MSARAVLNQNLTDALKHHAKNNLNDALRFYELAYGDPEIRSEVLFQNYGALLRKSGNSSKAIEVYERGLKLHPEHVGINLNYSNAIRDAKPALSAFIHIKVIQSMLLNNSNNEQLGDAMLFLGETLDKLGLCNWSFQIFREALEVSPKACIALANLLVLIDKNPEFLTLSPESRIAINKCLDSIIDTVSDKEKLDIYYAMGNSQVAAGLIDESIKSFDKADIIFNSIKKGNGSDVLTKDMIDKKTNSSWNMSCALLKQGNFSKGWKLFDYGLITPADGPQRWQRALFKPFDSQEIMVWKGESLENKSILLLEEQGVGDTMMFLTLVKKIIKEAKLTVLVIAKRLKPIYKRSLNAYIKGGKLQIIATTDFIKTPINSKKIHYQSPLGSICQYRFVDIKMFGRDMPLLEANKINQSRLKELAISNDKKLIGLSWRGGAKGTRMKQKSLSIPLFSKILKPYSDKYEFVNLQYGCSEAEYKEFLDNGIRIKWIKEINPLKDMDNWLDLVSLCDGVVSVANTTIHGAGGLGIPTMCMLGLRSDWRWLSDCRAKNSYWYPSVQIAPQKSTGWDDAIIKTQKWLATFI